MVKEASKAVKRRFNIGAFHSKYFVGHGIDIGAGDDCIYQYYTIFAGIKSVFNWDLPSGDAQYMQSVSDETYDFVHSSHCLEHMNDPVVALRNWIRITKPGGHLIVTVPDEDMYERGQWPSVLNTDHKWSFTVDNLVPRLPRSVSVVDLIRSARGAETELIKIEKVEDFFYPMLPPKVDQTSLPNTECAIEFILRKRVEGVA